MQEELATELQTRKCENIKKVNPDIIAAGNIGCITQISNGINIPIVHTIELIDWFTGGKKPNGLNNL
jgi:glycolate oxidase iron-sulfur subunit